MRYLRGLHSRCDEARVCRADMVGTESEMAQVDLAVIRCAQLQLDAGAGVDDQSKVLGAELRDHAEGSCEPFDVCFQVRHRQRQVVEQGLCHSETPLMTRRSG